MTDQEKIFHKIAESLLVDYSSVYYVNAITNEYYWYSANPEFHSLSLEPAGDDFFKNIIRDCKDVVYEEDQHIFINDIQKDKLLAAMKKGTMQNIDYRLMINGVPTWHSLRLIRGLDEKADFFVLGVINIDDEHRRKEQEAETARRKEVYDHITSSLASHYDTVYYIDIETGEYEEISSTDDYKQMNVPTTGNDFFAESRRNIKKYVHSDDQEWVMKLHYKEAMLEKLKDRSSFSLTYRLVVNDEVKHIRITLLKTRSGHHIINCIENIDAEVKAQRELQESQERSVKYTQIAESLASHYDLIYYVDVESEHYIEYSTHKIYGELEIQEEGDNFFTTSQENADKIIFDEDRQRIKLFLDKDNLISGLDNHKQLVQDYRMVIDEEKPTHTRMTIMWSSDHMHLIMCIENREEDVRKEQERQKELSRANEMARRDELTRTRNKTAYQEMEQDLQKIVDDKSAAFGIVICDINDLKTTNDTKGHKAGDELIKDSCKMICQIFSHSPVFRIGGDEFAVILKGADYDDRDALLSTLRSQVETHVTLGEGPVVASGIALFDPNSDKTVREIFERADVQMYTVKTALKEQKLLHQSHVAMDLASDMIITDERRKLLETLYKAFEIVAGGGYLYLCDMKFDFSRWSKEAVERYRLPSEYMYGAGDIWENHIHPDDRDDYHRGIDELFAGNASAHDMEYRALCADGTFDKCLCRGVVLRDLNGEPDYFVGSIRVI